MIESKELRIGNLFLERFTKEVLIVEELTVDKITFSGDYPNEWQAEPIPLTEKWLVKFGFEQSRENDEWMVLNRLTMLKNGLSVCVGHYQSWHNIGAKCKHVHQLQNLYFALTGEELKIK
jgi:hypothetical protein